MSGDVLAVMDKASGSILHHSVPLYIEVRDARAAVADLIALVGAMVETDRLVSREDIAELFWPEFVAEATKALARVKP